MIKKIFISISLILVTFILIFTFISKEDIHYNDIKDNIEENNVNEDSYLDDNPIILGLYKKGPEKRHLITEYTNNFTYHQDIVELEVYYSNEEDLSNSKQITLFDSYRDLYPNAYKYKIGYLISFTTTLENVNKTILSPKDTEDFFDYLEVYLYDDYHRESNEWYSHTTESEYNDDTILTSIKLTSGKQIAKITSDIMLTAFTYDEDDFLNGSYRGNSKYTVTIKKSNHS